MTFNVLEYEDILSGDNGLARREFLASFPSRIRPIARVAHRVHRRFELLATGLKETDQARHVLLYLHAAFNNVICSTNLLVNGYPLPSSHLMRQFAEASAMAMLLLDSKSGVFEQLMRDSRSFPYSKCIARVLRRDISLRLRHLLGLNPKGWAAFKRLSEFYHLSSHASAFSLSYHVKFAAATDLLIIGSEFDRGKRPQLSIELRRRRSGLERVSDLVNAARRVLPRESRRGRAT